MPRVERKKRVTTYTDSHVFHLLTGFDFFKDAFGDDEDAMRAAWPHLRQRVFDAQAERVARGWPADRRPWGERFDADPDAGEDDPDAAGDDVEQV